MSIRNPVFNAFHPNFGNLKTVLQTNLEKLEKAAQAVERKRYGWESEVKELEGALGYPRKITYYPTQNLKSINYKGILEKYGKMRLTKERQAQLKNKIEMAASFLETMNELERLLQDGADGKDSGFLQFSDIRRLIKTLRVLSLDLFTPGEAATDFGEICLDILTIRRPTIDLNKDYRELCF